MRELVVLSGKGGTGKTSIVGSLAALAEKKVMADCDVDAADLHLLLNPAVRHKRSSGAAVCRYRFRKVYTVRLVPETVSLRCHR